LTVLTVSSVSVTTIATEVMNYRDESCKLFVKPTTDIISTLTLTSGQTGSLELKSNYDFGCRLTKNDFSWEIKNTAGDCFCDASKFMYPNGDVLSYQHSGAATGDYYVKVTYSGSESDYTGLVNTDEAFTVEAETVAVACEFASSIA